MFYALFGLFFLLGAGVVLYAQGWRFDFLTWHAEKVGGIFVRSFPENADIFVNGKSVPNGSGFFSFSAGTLISDLFPRTYKLSLKATGYDAWTENAPVLPSFVTTFEHAVLVPSAPATTIVATSTIEHGETLTKSASGAYLLYDPAEAMTTTLKIPANAENPALGPPPFIAWTKFDEASDTSEIVIYNLGMGAEATSTATLPGNTVTLKWIGSNALGAIQNDNTLYLYTINTGQFQQLADDVKDFAGAGDGSILAALEHHSLEIFPFTNAETYARFNLPDVADAESVIWYKDLTHLFVVYPDHVAFLDLDDLALTNFTTVASGTAPSYNATTNELTLTTPSGTLARFDFPE